MRMIRYYVVDKTNGKTIYASPSESNCRAFVYEQANAENYAIYYKWMSI